MLRPMARRLAAFALLLVVLAPVAFAAGTVTTTERRAASYKVVKFAWTSSAGGAADATTAGTFCGKVDMLATVPGAGGVQPTDLYDVVVTDADGVDVLAGAGANRSNATTQTVVTASLGAVCYSTLTLAVTNAGNAKAGVLLLYVR